MNAPERFVNDPGGHKPHGLAVEQPLAFDLEVYRDDRDLFQVRSPQEAEQIDEAILGLAERDLYGALDLELFQMWCEQNWFEAQGSADAHKLVTDKLKEELAELSAELDNFQYPPTSDLKSRIVAEIGDVIWCSTALTSNLGINVKHALLRRFSEYGYGTRYDNGVAPSWVQDMQKRAFDSSNFKVWTLDKVVNAGYIPQSSPAMNIDREDANYTDISEAYKLLQLHAGSLIFAGSYLYGDDFYPSHVPPQTADNIAEIYLISAFIARQGADTSLAQVVCQNIVKLSERTRQGTLKKGKNRQ